MAARDPSVGGITPGPVAPGVRCGAPHSRGTPLRQRNDCRNADEERWFPSKRAEQSAR